MKKIVYFIFAKLGILVFYTLKKSGYLLEKGWFNSFDSKSAIDATGKPIPWLTYPFIDFISSRLNSDFEIFEFGSGNSSLWFLERVGKVTACEHQESWYLKMQKQSSDKFQILLRKEEDGNYAKSINENENKYDLILIDGIDRVQCALHATANIKLTGVIVWDDSVRMEYNEGFNALTSMGFKRLDFLGSLQLLSNHLAPQFFTELKIALASKEIGIRKGLND